ncbi:hypothetical protein OAD28_01290 [Flavobacteriales bacterium]|nr:hypothetical protein [Flavobacteriales bacterium]
MKNITISLFALLIISSCASPKESYIIEFGNFINEIELENSSYSDDDWKYLEVEFNDFAEIQYMDIENELTESEKKQVESYKKRYTKLRVKNDPTGNILEILGLD